MSRQYSVSMIFACCEGSLGGNIIDYEEQIRVIRAVNDRDLLRIALSIGRDSELSYPTENELVVYWKFVGICSFFEIIDDMTVNGAEVFSRHLGTEIVTDSIFQTLDAGED